jgi:3-oxoacyl-[acyl-carrier protein] reductase
MTGGLQGKVSLVTGASRGIGRAIAKALAAEGATVFVGARDAARLADVVRECTEAGGAAVAVSLDVADRASVDAALKAVLDAQGRIDHLVNNAGITRDNLLLRMKKEEWDDVLATNLTGTYLCTQAVLKPMLKQRSGRIVNVTSVVGLTGNAGQANYAASKAGIVGFTKAVAREVASRNVTVNAVAPGFIETEMTARIPFATREIGRRMNSLQQGGRPKDLAETIAWFVQPGAAAVTGQVVRVCGQSLLGA